MKEVAGLVVTENLSSRESDIGVACFVKCGAANSEGRSITIYSYIPKPKPQHIDK